MQLQHFPLAVQSLQQQLPIHTLAHPACSIEAGPRGEVSAASAQVYSLLEQQGQCCWQLQMQAPCYIASLPREMNSNCTVLARSSPFYKAVDKVLV